MKHVLVSCLPTFITGIVVLEASGVGPRPRASRREVQPRQAGVREVSQGALNIFSCAADKVAYWRRNTEAAYDHAEQVAVDKSELA